MNTIQSKKKIVLITVCLTRVDENFPPHSPEGEK